MDENNPIQESGVNNNETNNTVNTGAKKINNMGLISFIFSLVGLLVAGLPCGVIALITGIMGIVKFDKEREKFKWMAIVGLVVGIIDIIAVIANTVLKMSQLL